MYILPPPCFTVAQIIQKYILLFSFISIALCFYFLLKIVSMWYNNCTKAQNQHIHLAERQSLFAKCIFHHNRRKEDFPVTISISNDQNVILVKLKVIYPSLPRSEKAVASYLIEHINDIAQLSLNIISIEAKTSKPTVTRLCKRLGYSGFIDLRNNARSQLTSVLAPLKINSEPVSAMYQLMKKIISKNQNTMQNTLALISSDYDQAAESIINARCVHMFGNGDAIIPCEFFRIKLLKIGKSCSVYNDQDLQLFCAAATQPGDVVIAVSHTGRSRSVVESIRIVRERGIRTIAITATQKAPLLRYCDITLLAGTIDNSVDGDVISRRIAEQLILETLYQYITSKTSGNLQARMHSATLIRQAKIADSEPDSATL